MRKILYIQYTNPAGYPPLEHSSRILADADWKVLFLGTGAAGEADALRFPSHGNIVVRQIPFCSAGPLQKLHYLWFLLWTMGWALLWRPQWLYASDLLACPAALVLRSIPGVRLVYHEHDSPEGATGSLFLRLCIWARKTTARVAQICVLPNEKRAEQFSREIADGREVFRVWNCPRREEAREARAARATDELLVYYHGSVGPSYLPVTILDALALLPKGVRLLVIGYETVGCVGYIQQLRRAADRLDLKEQVQFLGAMPRSDILKHCGSHDVGIAFMPKSNSNTNEQKMVGASNKPFDYLACGLALLVSDLPEWRAMYVEAGYGLACDPDDPKSIAAGLRWFLDHSEEMREMGERGRKKVLAQWNYEQQFAPVLGLLTNARDQA